MASVPRGMHGWCCTVHIFSLGGYDAPAVILLLITLAGDVESNPRPPKIYTCPICSQRITNNKKYKGSVPCISCKDWVHTTCTTLTNTKQYTNTWTCTKCNAQATPPVTTHLALSTTNITPVRPTITPHQTMQDNSTPNSPSHTQPPSQTSTPTLNRAPRSTQTTQQTRTPSRTPTPSSAPATEQPFSTPNSLPDSTPCQTTNPTTHSHTIHTANEGTSDPYSSPTTTAPSSKQPHAPLSQQ